MRAVTDTTQLWPGDKIDADAERNVTKGRREAGEEDSRQASIAGRRRTVSEKGRRSREKEATSVL